MMALGLVVIVAGLVLAATLKDDTPGLSVAFWGGVLCFISVVRFMWEHMP